MKLKVNKTLSASSVIEKTIGPITIGMMIRSYRYSNELSVDDLAKKLKLKKILLTNVEAGKKKLSLPEVMNIVEKLGEYKLIYAEVWFEEQARDAGLEVEVTLRER